MVTGATLRCVFVCGTNDIIELNHNFCAQSLNGLSQFLFSMYGFTHKKYFSNLPFIGNLVCFCFAFAFISFSFLLKLPFVSVDVDNQFYFQNYVLFSLIFSMEFLWLFRLQFASELGTCKKFLCRYKQILYNSIATFCNKNRMQHKKKNK